jgi:phospholipid/cholesterol/gamma-HCH transport system substrate-binding protein
MKTKFNKYERTAGLFVLTSIIGGLAVFVGTAITKGWFERRVHFTTSLKTAQGVREGTQVQIAGLRAGTVTDVELKSNNDVLVIFEISEKFRERVRKDSVVRLVRPFIIGEKVLEIEVGSESVPAAEEASVLVSEATTDIMDLVSGRTLGPYLDTIGKMTENLRFVAETLLDPERSKAMVKIFDEIQPLVKNMSSMAGEATELIRDVNGKKQLKRMVSNLLAVTDEVNRMLPMLAKESPQLASDLTKIARNMAILTDEVQKTLPMMSQIGPELPRASRRAIEALDETVVTLKALQKSILLRGSVKDVRDEEAAREQRLPASEESTDRKQ